MAYGTKDHGPVIFLQAVNSLDYLEEVFRLYDSGTLFAVVKEGGTSFSHPGLGEGQVRSVGQRRGWMRQVHVPQNTDQPAQIVFTSGTEGRPKAVVLSHRNLADTVARLNAVMVLDATVREYIGVPVTYSFGLGRARAVSAAGGAFFLPERFDPVEIRQMLEADEINAISAVPSLWRIILAHPEAIGPAGEKVRWIEIGSQYMAQAEKEAMKALFPKARIVQHYGLTEASRTTFLDVSAETGNRLDSVGRGAAGTDLKIGPEGEVCIRGAHVALGVLEETGAIRPLTDAEGWFHTSDRGAIRDGLLWYQGRLDDQINITGIKIAAEVLERDIRALVLVPGDFAVTGVPDKLRGEVVLLALGPKATEARDLLVAAADMALRGHGIAQAGVLRVMTAASLPVTETGKVQRKRLREIWLATSETLSAPRPAGEQNTLTSAEMRVVEVWQSVVGEVPIGPGQSFYEVGGDSLSSVQIGLAMEGAFSRAAVRATLEGRPLREIAAMQGEAAAAQAAQPQAALPRATVESWAINATRGFMALTVLLSHWGPGVLQRLRLEDTVGPLISPFTRMGTAGFASVFGLGLGFFMLPRMAAGRASVAKRLRSSLVLVLAGLALTASAVLGVDLMAGQALNGRNVAEAFYNVLAFYAVALILALPVLTFLARRSDPMVWAVVIALALWPSGWAVMALLPADPVDSLLEWPRLLLVAKYGLFRTGPLVFLGIAAGVWLSRQSELAHASARLIMTGMAGLALLALIAVETYGAGPLPETVPSVFDSVLGKAMDYAFALVFAGGMMRVIAGWGGLRTVPRHLVQGLIILGGLALPIFAFHRIVIPLKDILVGVGLPEGPALLPPLIAFLAAFAYGWRRLRRMYFP